MTTKAYDIGLALGKRAQAPALAPSAPGGMNVTSPQTQLFSSVTPGMKIFGQAAPTGGPAASNLQPSGTNVAPGGALQQPPQNPTDGLIRMASAGGSNVGTDYAGQQPQGTPMPSPMFTPTGFQRQSPPPINKLTKKKNLSGAVSSLRSDLRDEMETKMGAIVKGAQPKAPGFWSSLSPATRSSIIGGGAGALLGGLAGGGAGAVAGGLGGAGLGYFAGPTLFEQYFKPRPRAGAQQQQPGARGQPQQQGSQVELGSDIQDLAWATTPNPIRSPGWNRPPGWARSGVAPGPDDFWGGVPTGERY